MAKGLRAENGRKVPKAARCQKAKPKDGDGKGGNRGIKRKKGGEKEKPPTVASKGQKAAKRKREGKTYQKEEIY